MEQLSHTQQDNQTTEDVSGRLARISEIKELLKTARGIPEEMSLLNDLTQEIIALRRLLEPRDH